MYLRDADRAGYLRELNAILTDPQIRPHVKDLAIALLGSVSDPGDDEWAIFEPMLQPMLDALEAGEPNGAEPLAALAWRHFFGSSSWFKFAVSKGLVQRWLATDGVLADMAANQLRVHERHAAEIVAQLLEPFVDSGGNWPTRLRSIAEWSDHTTSRRFFDLTLRLIDNGVLDDARGPVASNSTFWSLFYRLGKRRPEWVSEVISHWLRRRLEVLTTTGEDLTRGDLFGHDPFGAEPIGDARTGPVCRTRAAGHCGTFGPCAPLSSARSSSIASATRRAISALVE